MESCVSKYENEEEGKKRGVWNDEGCKAECIVERVLGGLVMVVVWDGPQLVDKV